jgi:hypothetical protein
MRRKPQPDPMEGTTLKRRRDLKLEVAPQHAADALMAIFGYTRASPAAGGESKTTDPKWCPLPNAELTHDREKGAT